MPFIGQRKELLAHKSYAERKLEDNICTNTNYSPPIIATSSPQASKISTEEDLYSKLRIEKVTPTDRKNEADSMARVLQMMHQKHVPNPSPPPEKMKNTNIRENTPLSKSDPTLFAPVLPPSVKQNYAAVVAGNCRPSVSDVSHDAKKFAPMLFSPKTPASPSTPPPKILLEPRVDRPKTPITRNMELEEMKKEMEEQRLSPSREAAEEVDIYAMNELSKQIWHFHNKSCQREKTLANKLSLRDLLYYAISPVFPMCGLYVVGSSLNGFGNDSSDMDLCLMITNKELDQKTDAVVVLNMVLNVLQQMEWVTHQKLILAKVPILQIKFAAPYTNITVDLNVNNSVAIKNTHLLCYYSSYDWRVRPLVSIVKEWARNKGINDAKRSSFTSYSLVLMIIHFLQCGTSPAILPSLQQLYPRRFNARADVRSLNVTLPLAAPDDFQFKPKTSLGELLIGFFKYFSVKFDYNSQAISIREGRAISRVQVTRCKSNYYNAVTWRSQWRCVCIEEPFTFYNTAHSIYDEMVFSAIKKAFSEAYEEVETTKSIDCLLNCKPIPVSPPVHGATAYVYHGGSKEATLESRMIVFGGGPSPKRIQYGDTFNFNETPKVPEAEDNSSLSSDKEEDIEVCIESPSSIQLIEFSPMQSDASSDESDIRTALDDSN